MAFRLNLLPQENRFYDLIGESDELSLRCVRLLQQLVSTEDPQAATKLGHDIAVAKARAKVVTAEITEKLCQTFITPLDREDIQALALGLYKIPKLCEKLQERLLAFGLKPFQNDFYKLTDAMAQAADHLHDLLIQLKTLKATQPVQDKTQLLNNIESATDALLSQLLVDLFRHEDDAKQILLRKDVYDLMEGVVDRHRDMGNLILQIVLKNA